MLRLSCVTQQYAWGKLGKDSMVARLKKLASNTDIVESEPYAELWMGTHCSGPSRVQLTPEAKAVHGGQDEVLLSQWLQHRPASVGKVPPGYSAHDLPFLFKVLSVRTALSIQAHPDKTLAAQLHATQPGIYKDPNHKPEMAIALTKFEALYGFRMLSEVRHLVCEEYPEFQAVLGEDTVSLLRSAGDSESESSSVIRTVLDRYMHCDTAVAGNALRALVARVGAKVGTASDGSSNSNSNSSSGAGSLDALLLRLHDQYPGDTGVFAPLLLNYLQLEPLQSFFMGAGVPHAYLSGDCVECMAPSDNVVRVGLTPKYKDVETLCSMLVYRCEKPTAFITPLPRDAHTVVYRPPASVCEEFEVEVTTVCPGAAPYMLAACECGSVLLVLHGSAVLTLAVEGAAQGEAMPLRSGDVLFLPASASACLERPSGGSEEDARDLVMFRAHANLGHA